MAGAHDQLNKEARAAWRTVLGCLAALAALAMALPGPGELATAVHDALTGGSRGTGASGGGGEVSGINTPPAFLNTAQDAVLLAAAVIVWGLLLWGLVIVIIAGAGRLPGSGGRAARKVLRHIAPAAAGRLVIAAVGVTAIVGVGGCAAPDGATAATVGVANAVSAPASSADPTAPSFDIDWPDALGSGTTGPPAGDAQAATAAASPTPGAAATSGPTDQRRQVSAPPSPAPTTPAPTPIRTSPATTTAATTPAATASRTEASRTEAPATTEPAGPPASTSKPVPSPNAAVPPTTTDPADPARASAPEAGRETAASPLDSRTAADGSVTVQPGDTLWAIAARHHPADATDAEIDTAWRTWYSANAELIGTDPDLIIPGQHLLPGN